MNTIGPTRVTINYDGGERTFHLSTTLKIEQVVAAILRLLDDEGISPKDVSSIHPQEIFDAFKSKI